MKKALLSSLLLVLAIASSSWAAALSDYHHIFITVANDAGVRWDYDGTNLGGPTNTYYIKADSGGLNAMHITTDPTIPAGQNTTTSTLLNSLSGSFYINTTGGEAWKDDAILLVSSSAPIANNFNINIKSSGYAFTAGGGSAPTTYSYVTNVLNETFGAGDFIYGPQGSKPGPSSGLAFYSGLATQQYLMFVDLKLGILKNDSLTDRGDVKVDFTIQNLYSDIAFNMYGWSLASPNSGEGINWTNDPATNGYFIDYTGAPAPVPIPPTLFLLAGGLGGLGFFRRIRVKRLGRSA